MLVTPGRNVHVREVIVEKRLVAELVKVIGVLVQAGFGDAENDAVTVSTFIVSAPRLTLEHPDASISINFGT